MIDFYVRGSQYKKTHFFLVVIRDSLLVTGQKIRDSYGSKNQRFKKLKTANS